MKQSSQQRNWTRKISRAGPRERLIALLIFLSVSGMFVVLSLAGKGFIDLGRILGPCGFQQRYHLPCPTCGMTHAAITFAKGEILRAFTIQPAGALLCTLLGVVGFLAFLTAVFGVYFQFLRRWLLEVKLRYLILAFFIVITGGWMVTLSRALAAR